MAGRLGDFAVGDRVENYLLGGAGVVERIDPIAKHEPKVIVRKDDGSRWRWAVGACRKEGN